MSRPAPSWTSALERLRVGRHPQGHLRRRLDLGTLVEGLRRLPERLRGWFEGPTTVAHCPIDDWDFAPYFTGGHCPLCGFEAPGDLAIPAMRHLDWFWPLAGAMVAMSILMVVLVVVAYNR